MLKQVQHDNMRKAILLTIISVVLFAGLAVMEYFKFNDGKLHVIFCDVGQGDAIFIRTPDGKNLLIDGGPDRKVLNCLSSYMPFWERNIDLMVLTHPHADHFMGMYYVLERYSVTAFATEKLENKSGEFQGLIKQLRVQGVPIRYVYQGDNWTIPAGNFPLSIYHLPFIGQSLNSQFQNKKSMENGTWKMENLTLSILGPSKEFLDRTSPGGKIGESKEFASLVSELSFGNFHALFTGDTQTGELGEIVDELDLQDKEIDVLQSPHHGSRTGLTKDIVQKILPKISVISVGQRNRYGHPNKAILDLFQEAKVPVLRTDEDGDLHIVSDGASWSVLQ